MTENKKMIMIAEDDPGIVDAMKLMLEIDGYDVLTTADGQTLLKMKDNLPDLILLDIWMSGSDGLEICKTLKKQNQTKNIPIVIVSARHDALRDVQLAGADDFLAKPFEMDELLSMVLKHTS